MHIGSAEALTDAYGRASANVREAMVALSPNVTQALALLNRGGQNPLYGPIPALQTLANDLRTEQQDVAWRVDWLVSTDAQPLGLDGRVRGFIPADLETAFQLHRLTPEQIETAERLMSDGISFTDAVAAAQTDDPDAALDDLRLAELNDAIDNWNGTDNDPILDALLRERREVEARIAERDQLEAIDQLRLDSISGTAEALGIPEDYAEVLIDALGLEPGEIIVGFGGIDVSREDIRQLIESTPAEYQFAGFMEALQSTAVTESQLLELQASETSATHAYLAWVSGDAIDENDLADHNLVFETLGHEDLGTWRVIRNEHGIAIAAWYEAAGHANAIDNMTLAESTAFYRRVVSTGADETYQDLLDSGDYGETNAAAFAFMKTGDADHADDVRLGAWPGNYTGAVYESAVTDPHVWLDGIGLIPLVGEWADAVNAGLYLIEGDYTNAGISTAALIPFIGSLGPARRVADDLGGELIQSVQVAETGQVIHTIQRADGTIVNVVQITDGQILGGPSTLVRGVDGAETGARQVDEFPDGPPSNAANQPSLADDLAHQEAASAFDEAGNLRPEIIAKSTDIIPGNELGNPAVIAALTSDGSDISDWAKWTTSTISSPSGDFKVHFYRNVVTGEVNTAIDYKIVFNARGSR